MQPLFQWESFSFFYVLLKKIVFNSKIDIDIIDLKNNNNRENGIIDNSYLDEVQNLEVNVYNGLYYISNVRGIVREEKKLERKAKIKKFFGLKQDFPIFSFGFII